MSTYKRVNTMKINFDPAATRPAALEIHHWLVNYIGLNIDQVDTVQLNSRERAIYVRVMSPVISENLLHKYEQPQDFRYEPGEITKVTISASDTYTITVRCFNLPPEVPNSILTRVLSKYGKELDIKNEKSSTKYLLPVNNGIKAVRMEIKDNIPATLNIANYQVSLSYPGQVQTCFICHESIHLKEQCPKQRTSLPMSDILQSHLTSQSKEDTDNINISQETHAMETETENSTTKRKHTAELDLQEETESGSEGERESDVLPVKDKIKRKQHDNKEIVLLTIDPPTGRSAYKSNISGNNHPVTSNDKSMEKMYTLSSSGMIQESTQNDLQLETQEGKNDLHAKQSQGECVYAEMQEIKHKLCAIQKNVMEGTAIRARQLSMAAEERSALYHIVKEKQRGQMHYITNLKNTNGDDLKTTKQCLNEARNYYIHLYQRTPTSEEASNFLFQGVKQHINLDQHDAMARRITLQEIESALKQTTSNTAPGPDGLTYNFYKSYWQYVKDSLLEAFNEIYIEHKIPLGFTDGIIVLIPKRSPKTITDFRPISLLNTDYKLLMKVMVNCLKEVLPDIIQIGQTCGIPGRNIFQNLATVRNAIMHYHIHPNEQAALISLDL
ncbi:hypothetical protein ANN_22083 [Periplaneta americana]|uniref:Reverse transcriptase n=1 Tax=Periplaneta americana TaxID=6978 RepID=A0ABQ8S749_PERAM|nr:hypothetical protein ANN_22083 [Periplaneta americana]